MKMRSLTAWALVILLGLSLFGCGAGETPAGSDPVNGSGEGIALDGVPLTDLVDLTWEMAAGLFGSQPTITPEQGRNTLGYSGMLFYTRNGMLTQIQVEDPALLTKNGTSLALDRDGLAELLGEPAEEEQREAGYNIWYEFEEFTLSFLNGERDGTQWDVSIDLRRTGY